MSGWRAKTTGGDGDFPQAPVGNHRAVLVGMVNLGQHYEEFKAKKEGEKDQAGWKEKVYLLFELLDEQNEGAPWVVGKMYTKSLNERAALSGVYASLVGPVPEDDDADISTMLGKACMVEIGPSSNPKYTDVKKVSGAFGPDKKKPPTSARKPFLCDIHEEIIDNDLPRIYGKTISQVMNESKERSGPRPPQQGNPYSNGGNRPAAAEAPAAV